MELMNGGALTDIILLREQVPVVEGEMAIIITDVHPLISCSLLVVAVADL